MEEKEEMIDIETDELNIEKIKEYMPGFKKQIDDLDSDIILLNTNSDKLSDEINNTKEQLNLKISDVEETVSEEKEKISASESPETLTSIANKLITLASEKKQLEEELENKLKEFDSNKKELNEKLELRNSIKEKLENMEKTTAKEIFNIVNEYEEKINKINQALEVCDNSKIKEALEEEKNKMQEILSSKKEQANKEIQKELEILNPTTTDKEEKSSDDIKVETTVKKEELKPVENAELDTIKPVDVSPIIFPESTNEESTVEQPKSEEKVESDVKVEIPIEEKKVTLELPDVTFEKAEKISAPMSTIDFEIRDREVIQRDIVPEGKVEQIQNSSVIKESINNFFQKINSEILTLPKENKTNEVEELKTIEDDNVKDASLDDNYYIGAPIVSNVEMDVYENIDDLKTRFNPQRKYVNDNISSVVLLEKNQVINESSTLGTVLTDIKYSSGVQNANPEIVFKLSNNGYILYDNNKLSVIDYDKKEMKVGR